MALENCGGFVFGKGGSVCCFWCRRIVKIVRDEVEL